MQGSAHIVSSQRNQTPGNSERLLHNPHQPEAYPAGLMENGLQDNSMTSHPSRLARRGSSINGFTSTMLEDLSTQASLDLPRLHTRYKNMLRLYHDLSPDELRYLQKLKLLLQQSGYIKNTAGNQANRLRTAQDVVRRSSVQFPLSQQSLPNNGSSSRITGLTGTPQISGISSTHPQHPQSQSQIYRSNATVSQEIVQNAQTQQKTKRKAKQVDLSRTPGVFEEALIAPQPKRVRRFLGQSLDAVMSQEMPTPELAVNGTTDMSVLGSSSSPKSAVHGNNDSLHKRSSSNAGASTFTQPDQGSVIDNESTSVTLHKASPVLSQPKHPWEAHTLNRNRSDYYEKVSDVFEREQLKRVPKVTHYPNGEREETWVIGGGEETMVKPKGLIEHFVPPDTVLSVISKDAGNTYVCPSGSRDREHRTYMSLCAGQMGLMASYQVKAKEEAGVPRQHIKMIIYDDRVAHHGPTAAILATGDVRSLAGGRSMSNEPQPTTPLRDADSEAENNCSEQISVTPALIETDPQKDRSGPSTTVSPDVDVQGASDPASVSFESSDNNVKTTDSDPTKSSLITEGTIINERGSNSPLTTGPTLHEPFDASSQQQLPPLSEDEVNKLSPLRLQLPTSCADAAPQAQEIAETASSSLLGQQQMEEPAVAAPAAGSAAGEYDSQSTTLGSNGVPHNETSQSDPHAVPEESHDSHSSPIPSDTTAGAKSADEGPESPKHLTESITATTSGATDAITENAEGIKKPFDFMADISPTNLPGNDLFDGSADEVIEY